MDISDPNPAGPPDWRAVVLTSIGILRSIPLGCRDDWFTALTKELSLLQRSPSELTVLRLQAFIRIILAPLPRGGKAHLNRSTRIIRERIARWDSADFHSLIQDHFKASTCPSPPRPPRKRASDPVEDSFLPDAPRRAILRAIREGELGKASKLLDAVWGQVSPEVIKAKVPPLYPSAPPPSSRASAHLSKEDFTPAEIERALLLFPKGSSGGLGGLMVEHLSGDSGCRTRCIEQLAQVVSDFAWNRFPSPASSLLAGAKLVCLPKKDGGLRPIAVGELIRRIAGKVLLARYLPAAVGYLRPIQVGVSQKSAIEEVVHRTQLRADHPEGCILAQVDLRNAFGCISRQAFLTQIESVCPSLLPYAMACYGQPSTVSNSIISASVHTGVQQGDPLGPLFFAVGLHPVISAICHQLKSAWWYLDDGTLVGTPAQIASCLEWLEPNLRSIGLEINRAKTIIWTPTALSEPLPSSLSSYSIAPPDQGVTVLGTPVGAEPFVLSWLSKRLTELDSVWARLTALGNAQGETLVLRACLGPCKITHLLRCLRPKEARWLAAEIGPRLHDTWETILGSPLSPSDWALAKLPIHLGGLGASDPRDWWPAAQTSSWISTISSSPCSLPVPADLLETIKLLPQGNGLAADLLACCSEGWPQVNSQSFKALWCQQHNWSMLSYSQLCANCDACAPQRTQDLRAAHCLPHAGDWLAKPLSVSHHSFSSDEWRVLLRFHLGLPISSKSLCSACGQQADRYGDHALGCPSCGTVRRHNKMRDLIAEQARRAGWHTQLEVCLPSTDSSRLRPADILLPNKGAHPLALDIGISHPLRASAPRIVSACPGESAARQEADKKALMQAQCQAVSWRFQPLCFESTGGWGPGASFFLRHLAKVVAARSSLPPLDCIHEIAAITSACLAQGCAEMLLRSIR